MVGDGEVTETHLAIISLTIKGQLRKEMSAVLQMTESTVNSHIADLYQRLRVRKVGRLVALAMASGFSSDGRFMGRDVVKQYQMRKQKE